MDKIEELIKAAEALIEDAELIDGRIYGEIVSPTLLDRLRSAVATVKEDS